MEVQNIERLAEMGRKKGFHYGWIIVFVMATAGTVSAATGLLSFGLFIKPIGASLGIGRAWFGLAQTARQVTSALTSPVVGRLLDRYGSRVMLPVAALVTACAMVALSFLGSANGAVIMVVLFAMMGLVDLSASGALIISVPVLKWFVRERGKAIAYTGLGIPIGALIFVPLTQMFIDWWGWETAWVVLAAIVAGS